MHDLGGELLFEPGEAPADRGLRDAQVAGRRSQALAPDDFYKCCNIVPIDVHLDQ